MKRVVITGLGVVSPLGNDVNTFWENIKRGTSGVKPLNKLDPAVFQGNTLSAEVRESVEVCAKEDLTPYSKAVEYALGATQKALTDAGYPSVLDFKNRFGLIIGTTNGTEDIVERTINAFDICSEDENLSPEAQHMLSHFRPVELSAVVARNCNLGGTNMVIPTACTAGNYAFGTAFSMIQEGRSEVVVAGGSDPFTRSCYTIFYRLGAMTREKIKPFAQDRTGMVVGEGAGMMVLEELEHALKRNATIYAEVTGYGLSCDAYHPTAPDPAGNGAYLAMKKALASSNLNPEDISYISAHGTGTKANDAHEVNAMYKVFDENLSGVPIHGLKSIMGHCMGAASAFEAISIALSLKEQVIPSTYNTDEIDQSFPIGIDLNQNGVKASEIEHVLSNSFAFGGNICSIIFSRYN